MQKFTKKSISFLMSLLILCSSLAIGEVVSASQVPALNTSLIYGVKPNSWIIHDETTEPVTEIRYAGGYEFFTDGSENQIDLNGVSFYNADKSFKNSDSLKMYHDFVFSLDEKTGMPVQVNQFYLHTASGDASWGSFEVYFSRELEHLTDEENKIIEYDNEQEKKDRILLTLDTPVIASYMLVRVTKGCQDALVDTYGVDAAYPRIKEIAVFGNANPAVGYNVENNKSGVNVDESLIKGINVTYTLNDSVNGTKNIYPDWLVTSWGKITEFTCGNVDLMHSNLAYESGNYELSKKGINLGNSPDQTLDIVASLTEKDGRQTDVSGFYIEHAANDGSNQMTYKYAVYISDTLENLDSTDSLVATYTNKDLKKSQYITFDRPVSGAYIMVRVVMNKGAYGHPFSEGWNNDRITRIKGFAVFGTSTDDYTLDSNSPDDFTKSVLYGTSADTSLNTAIQTANAGTEKEKIQAVTANSGVWANLTDGNLDTSVDFGYNSGDRKENALDRFGYWTWDVFRPYLLNNGADLLTYEDFIFDLRAKYNGAVDVSQFYVGTTNSPDRAIYKIELYAGNKRDGIICVENHVATVSNITKGQSINVNFADSVTASYVGVRIIFCQDYKTGYLNWDCTRISEVAVFGTAHTEYTVTANTRPSDTLSNSYISGKKPDDAYIYDAGDVYNLNSQTDLSKITDGDASSYFNVEYSVDGNDPSTRKGAFMFKDVADSNKVKLRNLKNSLTVYSDIVYKLTDGADPVSIKEVYIGEGFIDPTLHSDYLKLRGYSYEIYVADTKEELGKEQTLVATVINANASESNLVKFANLITGRYVMIRVTMGTQLNAGSSWGHDNMSYARLAEFAVFNERQLPASNVTDGADPTTEFSKSLISGKAPTDSYIYDSGTKYSTSAYPTIGNLTDGNVATGAEFSGSDLVGKYYTAAGEFRNESDNIVYNDFIYQLGKSYYTATVEEVYLRFLGSDTDKQKLSASHYQIFVSDSLDDIGQMLVADVYNNNSSTGQLVKFTDTVKGKYIMIRVLNGVQPDTSFKAESYLRVAEIAVFGEQDIPDVDVRDNEEPAEDLTDSIIYNSMPYDSYIYDTGAKYSFKGVSRLNVLTNSKKDCLEMSWDLPIGRFKDINGNFRNQGAEPEVYDDFIYQIANDGKKATVESVYAIWAGGNANMFTTAKWAIYIADSADMLGTEESLVKIVDNANMAEKQLVVLNKPVKGTYIMIRILQGIQPNNNFGLNECYARVVELAVFGERAEGYVIKGYTDGNFQEYDSLEVMDQAKFDSLGESLLKGKKTYKTAYSGVAKEYEGYDTNVTDGSLNTGVGMMTILNDFGNPNNDYFDFIWNLGEDAMEIDSVFYATNIGLPNWGYWTGRYQVYVAIDYEDLFLPENCVYEFSYKLNGVSFAQFGTWTKNKPVGCYVALRVIDSTVKKEDWGCMRVTEFAVYGKKANLPVTPVNLAGNMPVEVYSVDGEKNTRIELDIAMVKAMTDGNNETYATLNTDNKKLDIVYNLSQNARIYGFSLETKAGFVKGMKVYVSDDYNALWDKNSLVYTNNGNNETGKTFENPITGRFIRFEIPENSGKKIKVAEVAVNGFSDQYLKIRNILPYVNFENSSVFEYNLSTGDIAYLDISSDEIMRIADSDMDSAGRIFGAKAGESSLNYMFNLDDAKNLQNITVYFDYQDNTRVPVKGNIYIGDTLEAVTGKNRKALKTFSAVPDENGWAVDVIPTQTRYVCLEIIKMSDDYYYDDQIAPMIMEIKVNATNIRGMNNSGDSDALYTFTDAGTGIKWEIVRASLNDVYTKVASSKLIKTKLSTKQINNVAKSGYKPIGECSYEIAFYDRTGKAVTDLGGRKVRIYYPNTEGIEPLTTIVFNLTANSADAMNSTQTDDELYMYSEYIDYSSLVSTLGVYTGEYYVEPEEELPVDGETDNSVTDDTAFNNGGYNPVTEVDGETEVGEETDNKKVVIKKSTVKKYRKNNTDSFNWLWVIIPSAVVVAAGAAVAVVLIIKKKKAAR